MYVRKKEIKNDFVDSYYYFKYKSGIIHLMINTKNRWVNYHRYNDNEIGIGDGVGTGDGHDEFILEIPDLEIPSHHLPTEIQEKDQINFYWIPYDLIND